jgi:hypothetical protein
VLSFGVREVVADAPLLAETAEEIEVAFVVLGLVVADRVCLHQALVDREGVVGQQRIEDLHDAQVLEDPAVGPTRWPGAAMVAR